MGPWSRPSYTITPAHVAQAPQLSPSITLLEPLTKTIQSSVGPQVRLFFPTSTFSTPTYCHHSTGSSPRICHASPPFRFLHRRWSGTVVSQAGMITRSGTHCGSHSHLSLLYQALTFTPVFRAYEGTVREANDRPRSIRFETDSYRIGIVNSPSGCMYSDRDHLVNYKA